MRSRLKIEDVLRQHLERYVERMGRIELAAALRMSPANLDYIRSGYRMRGKKRQDVDFPPKILDSLAAIDDISIAEKMREIAIETGTMEVIAAPEASAESPAPESAERHLKR